MGLLIEYKSYQKHGGYLLKNSDTPGFSQVQKQQLIFLVEQHKADIDPQACDQLGACETQTTLLLKVLRLAVILTMRRKDDVLPDIKLVVQNETLVLSIPHIWLGQHPLMLAELEQEIAYQAKMDWKLAIDTI